MGGDEVGRCRVLLPLKQLRSTPALQHIDKDNF